MIILKFNNQHKKFVREDVIYVRILDVQLVAPGRWRLVVDEMTPSRSEIPIRTDAQNKEI